MLLLCLFLLSAIDDIAITNAIAMVGVAFGVADIFVLLLVSYMYFTSQS